MEIPDELFHADNAPEYMGEMDSEQYEHEMERKNREFYEAGQKNREVLFNKIQCRILVTDDGCHEWQGSHNGNGYGEIRFKRQKVYVHRIALAYKLNRDLMTNEDACHRCDNPKCVKLDHLFAGSRRDNIQDAKQKNRLFFQTHPQESLAWLAKIRPQTFANRVLGERQHLAKLTADRVVQMRKEYANGKRLFTLAEKYGVTRQAVKAVVTRRTWKHI